MSPPTSEILRVKPGRVLVGASNTSAIRETRSEVWEWCAEARRALQGQKRARLYEDAKGSYQERGASEHVAQERATHGR